MELLGLRHGTQYCISGGEKDGYRHGIDRRLFLAHVHLTSRGIDVVTIVLLQYCPYEATHVLSNTGFVWLS